MNFVRTSMLTHYGNTQLSTDDCMMPNSSFLRSQERNAYSRNMCLGFTSQLDQWRIQYFKFFSGRFNQRQK